MPPVTQGPFTVNVSNVVISNLTVDWTNTHLLELDSSNQLTVSLKGITIGLEFDAGVSFFFVKNFDYTSTGNTILITDLNVDLSIGFNRFDNGHVYAYIASKPTIHMQDVESDLTFANLQDIIDIGKKLGIKPTDIGNALAGEIIVLMNSTIISKSAEALYSTFNTVVQETIMINSTAPETPYTFSSPDDDYLIIALDFTLTDLTTGQVAPGSQPAPIPDFVENGLPMQVIVGEGLVEKGVWASFKFPSVELTLNQAALKEYLSLATELLGVVGLNQTQLITQSGYMVLASEFVIPSN